MMDDPYLKGKLLLSMPNLKDGPFARALIYMCVHDSKGAMGLIVNKTVEGIKLTDVFRQLKISGSAISKNMPIQLGGPVDNQRGFILHSNDHSFNGTMKLDNLSMSSSAEALREIAKGNSPKNYFVALGYAGWGQQQLDQEIQRNMWLSLPFDEDLVFGTNHEDKWDKAMANLGLSPHSLSSCAGHA